MSPAPAHEFKSLVRVVRKGHLSRCGSTKTAPGLKPGSRAKQERGLGSSGGLKTPRGVHFPSAFLKALRELGSAEARAVLRGAAALWWRRAKVTAARGRRLPAQGLSGSASCEQGALVSSQPRPAACPSPESRDWNQGSGYPRYRR